MTSAIETAAMRKVYLRILPLTVVMYFLCYIDRINVSFAALTMNKDIGLSSSAFGLGGGLFFIAYVLFEVPSNVAMQNVGARLWLARIMLTWGIISALMALVAGEFSFYLMRTLLGAAEAGFFPGVILYLTYWFPKRYRGRIVALFMVAIPLSSFLGSPLSSALLKADGLLGLHGWQWLFILEGVPAVLLGVLCLIVLSNGPAQAKWLSPLERDWLRHELAAEVTPAEAAAAHSAWRTMWNKNVLILALIYSGASATSNALSLWQPQILKSYGLTTMQTGFANAVPFGIASVVMLWWGWRSDRSGERVWNTAVPLAVVAISFLVGGFFTALLPMMIVLTLALSGTYAIKGPFFSLATDWLSGAKSAAGIAQINALGNLGAFAATWLLGVIKDETGSYPLALLPLVVLAGFGAVAVVLLGQKGQQPLRIKTV